MSQINGNVYKVCYRVVQPANSTNLASMAAEFGLQIMHCVGATHQAAAAVCKANVTLTGNQKLDIESVTQEGQITQLFQ